MHIMNHEQQQQEEVEEGEVLLVVELLSYACFSSLLSCSSRCLC